ncbi:hypothetical protein Syun_017464 [Stephania yunnanensis]|uniref:Uncharacterized protein n=1 Tax=Stephania yunnanensis TaxID=152371 RepID=A0AAP0J6L1_9MAGN
MTMGDAGATVYYNLKLRNPTLDLPIINYDLALLIQPMLMLGIRIGVAFNVKFADWMEHQLRLFFKGVETVTSCASVVVDGQTVSLGLWDTTEEVVMVVETIDVVTEVVEKVAEGVEENTICLIFDHFSGFREMCGYRFVVLLVGCRTLRIS